MPYPKILCLSWLIWISFSCNPRIGKGQIWQYCSKDSCQEVEVLDFSYGNVLLRDSKEHLHTLPLEFFQTHYTLEYQDNP